MRKIKNWAREADWYALAAVTLLLAAVVLVPWIYPVSVVLALAGIGLAILS